MIAIIAAVILLGGAFFIIQKSNTGNQSSTGTTTSVTSGPTDGSNNDSTFASLKDALSKSMTLKCEQKLEDGSTVLAYIKNGRVRMEGIQVDANTKSGNVIINGDKTYIWDTGTKKGFMMTAPKVTGQDQVTTQQSQTDYVGQFEQYKQSCKVAVVSDSVFTPPSDVEFTDFSIMMQKVQENTKKVPSIQLPSGLPQY